MKLRTLLLALGALLAAGCDEADPVQTAAPAQTNAFPECTYEDHAPIVNATINYRIPMRDCVHLSTNVTFPAHKAERYPVILIRTPYGKGNDRYGGFSGITALFHPYGFVTIIQDTRGRFESEGVHVVLKDEPSDTEDTLAWLERQPWFDGRVGVWGLSYLAMSSIAAGIARPDLVDALVVGIMGSDFYTLGADHGVARADGLRFASGTVTSDSLDGIFDDAKISEEIQKFPLAEADVRAGLGSVPFKELFMQHLDKDDFWLGIIDPAKWRASNLPIYMLTGWYDFQWRSQVLDWNALYARRGTQDLYLHIGPWPHLLGFLPVHDYPFSDPRTGLEALADSVNFMRRYVLGEDVFNDEHRVTYYDGGTGQWHRTDRLWPAQTQEMVFYPANALTPGDCPGRLVDSPAAAETTGYTYDPYEVFELPGVMTLFEGAMKKEALWCGRSDAVVFETSAFTEDVEIAGDILADLDVSTDVEDTPFVARLSLVETDGEIYNLREGVMLLSHREGDEQKVAYSPGDRATLTVPITPLRWTLHAGEKLRLGIASTAWPMIVPHPNVAGDWVNATEGIVAHQTIHLGIGSDTKLRLTIRPQR